MMRRRGAMGRRGPGVVGTVARTAVVVGTATAVGHGVDRRMDRKDAAKAQHAEAEQAALQSQDEIADMQVQLANMQAQQTQAAIQAQAAPAPPAGAPDLMAKLQQLAQLKESGALNETEYAAAKAKLLA